MGQEHSENVGHGPSRLLFDKPGFIDDCSSEPLKKGVSFISAGGAAGNNLTGDVLATFKVNSVNAKEPPLTAALVKDGNDYLAIPYHTQGVTDELKDEVKMTEEPIPINLTAPFTAINEGNSDNRSFVIVPYKTKEGKLMFLVKNPMDGQSVETVVPSWSREAIKATKSRKRGANIIRFMSWMEHVPLRDFKVRGWRRLPSVKKASI